MSSHGEQWTLTEVGEIVETKVMRRENLFLMIFQEKSRPLVFGGGRRSRNIEIWAVFKRVTGVLENCLRRSKDCVYGRIHFSRFEKQLRRQFLVLWRWREHFYVHRNFVIARGYVFFCRFISILVYTLARSSLTTTARWLGFVTLLKLVHFEKKNVVDDYLYTAFATRKTPYH